MVGPHDHNLKKQAKAPEVGQLERWDVPVQADSGRLSNGKQIDGSDTAETRPKNLAVYYILRAK
jgi:hypothetical protein